MKDLNPGDLLICKKTFILYSTKGNTKIRENENVFISGVKLNMIEVLYKQNKLRLFKRGIEINFTKINYE